MDSQPRPPHAPEFPAPPAPPGARRVAPERFAELDGYRGIAALMIVLYHAYLRDLLARDYTYLVGTPLHFVFRNLNAGVPCFFVLSGFVLFLPFARAAIAQRGAQPPGHFLRRRALRILPAYYLALGVVWAAR